FLTVQRMTELSATLAFAGIWGFTATIKHARSSTHVLLALAILGSGTILSYLCKENGALAPLLALVACGTILRARISSLDTLPRRLAWGGLLLPSLAVAYVLLQRILDAP